MTALQSPILISDAPWKVIRSARTKALRQCYESLVDLIARSDQPDDFNLATVAASDFVELLADEFRKPLLRVAFDVLAKRCAMVPEKFS